jgi:general secretion pathway protein K
MSSSRERGFALVTAVVAVAAFAYVAFQVLAAEQGGSALLAARSEQTRLSAAAEAGVAMAIHGVAEEDRALRWDSDGRSREVQFAGADLTIVVEDDHGKAPLNQLSDGQARALFQGAGVPGDRLDALVSEFRDWRNEQIPESVRRATPEHAVRHGPIATPGELIGMKGMDAAVLSRIAPVVTTFDLENAPFVPRYAQPLAIAAMSGVALDTPESLAAGPAARTELNIIDDSPVGHTLTIRVTARTRDGARAGRTAVVEMTGGKVRPYWVRYVE